ncbi:hypothetical protein CYMTET_30015, partial [Cymbomonas tetramitiformis]
VNVSRAEFWHNRVEAAGAALLLEAGAKAVVTGALFVENEALTGACLQADSTSASVLENCSFHASRAVNGSVVCTEGDLTVTGSSFEGNEATGYGQLYIDLLGQQVSVEDSVFLNNTAENGAVMYVAQASAGGSASRVTFAELDCEGNAAQHGAHFLFWAPWQAEGSNSTGLNRSAAPECANCTFLSQESGYSSEHTPTEGLATQAWGLQVDAVQAGQSSGYVLLQPIIVEVVDMYGETVTSDSSSVVMEIAGEGCAISGTVVVTAVAGVANFSNAVFQGRPGTQCQVDFVVDKWGETFQAATVVPLLECVPGEVYNRDALRCTPCLEDEFAFNNESATCYDCLQKEGQIKCFGGASYRIEDGYWLAPSASGCDDEECFMERLYECEQPAACMSTDAAQRSGTMPHSVADDLRLCATEAGYSGGLLCGGTLPVVCSSGNFVSAEGDACLACPPTAQVVASWVGIAVAIALMVPLVALLSRRLSTGIIDKAKMLAEEHDEITGAIGDLQESLQSLAQLVGMLLGYLQVIHQFGTLYSGSIVPKQMLDFVSNMYVVDLDISVLFNLQCAQHILFPNLGTMSPYWTSFIQATITPWGLTLLFSLIYGIYIAHHRLGNQKEPQAQDAHERVYYQCNAGALFFLTLLHPSVSTVTMQLFDCVDYYYEQPQTQSWLQQGSSIECGTTKWWIAVIFASFTIVTYLVGYPLGIFLFMWRCRKSVKCRICRADTQHLPGELEASKSSAGDFEHDGYVDVYVKWRNLEKIRSMVDEEEETEGAPASGTSLAMDDGADKGCALKEEKTLNPLHAGDEAGGGKEPEEEEEEEVLLGLPRKLQLSDGTFCMVRVHEKEDEGYLGRIRMVPMTWLDSEQVQKMFGSTFLDPYEDRFYYYMTVEILRRVLQTGAVLLVKLVAKAVGGHGEPEAVVYGLFISIFALCMHIRLRPFKADDDDNLMMSILANQCICQYMIISIATTDGNSATIGYFLVLLQVMLVVYALQFIFPVALEVFGKMFWQVRALQVFVARHLSKARAAFYGKPANNESTCADGPIPATEQHEQTLDDSKDSAYSAEQHAQAPSGSEDGDMYATGSEDGAISEAGEREQTRRGSEDVVESSVNPDMMTNSAM